MRSPGRSNSRNVGFTLIEVVVSIGVFSLILVGGFAAVGSMLNVQRDIYQRTVAASLVMALADWRRTEDAALRANWKNSHILDVAVQTPEPTTVFVGGIPADIPPTFVANNWFTVTTDATDSLTMYNLTAYSDLIVYIGPPVADSFSYHCLVTVWQGTGYEFTDTTLKPARRLRFLGRYVMPDGFN